jgi:hypothetical protein
LSLRNCRSFWKSLMAPAQQQIRDKCS